MLWGDCLLPEILLSKKKLRGSQKLGDPVMESSTLKPYSLSVHSVKLCIKQPNRGTFQ